MKLGIFNEFLGLEENYSKACKDLGVDFEIIDIISDKWIENIQQSSCDGFLVRPSAKKETWKKMYDEKLYFVSKKMGKKIYPSYDEIFIYENKKNLAYWLKINNVPHPKTWIFYSKNEALDFIENYKNYPLVFKTSIGSASSGVVFMNKKKALKTINRIFTKYRFFNKGYAKKYKTKYMINIPIMDDKQYNFIIFQEKANVKYEWRVIKIGKSYFAHQKLFDGKFHSGSGLVGWEKPSDKLLYFAKDVCEHGNFNSMALDIFETVNGIYLVNELQTMFGSYLPYQMKINEEPGRYLFSESDKLWIFEKGIFNKNGSCNLRVEDFIEMLENKIEKK